MKTYHHVSPKYYLLIFYLFAFTLLVNAQWKVQTLNSGTAQPLTTIGNFSINTIVAAGNAGTLTRSTDGGVSWNVSLASPAVDYWASSFNQSGIGWIVGSSGTILKTTNAGLTWSTQSSGISSTINGVYAFDDLNVFAVGDDGKLLKSTNGGNNWTFQSIPNAGSLRAVHFLDAQIGFISGGNFSGGQYLSGGFIYRTSDGGNSWVLVKSTTNIQTAIQAVSNTMAYSVGIKESFYRSTDGGLNWASINSGTKIDWLFALHFFTNIEGFIFGGITNTSSLVNYTVDGANSWTKFSNNSQKHILGCTFPNSNTGFLSADGGMIFKLTNGANNGNITWADTIHISDLGNDNGNLILGQSPIGSDSIDVSLQEFSLPPVPPTGIFDIRFELPTYPLDYSLFDFRNDSMKVRTWIIKFQPGAGSYPFTFTWNPTLLPAGTFYLKDLVNGTIVNLNMNQNNSYTLTNTGISSLKIEYNPQSCANVILNQGWNILSVPVLTSNMTTQTLFPNFSSPTYQYNNGYQAVTTLSNGLGYWLRYTNNGTISICGAFVNSKTIPVHAGWNMIGGYEKDIPVAQITTTPAGILTSSFFGFNNGYIPPTSLQSGKGYWIRSAQEGVINIPTSLSKPLISQKINTDVNPDWGKIVFTDKNGNEGVLYNANGNINLSNYDLPPVPPPGIFDIRFGSDRKVESLIGTKEIKINSAVYPVSVTVEGMDINLRDNINGKLINRSLKNGEILILENSSLNTLIVDGISLPLDYCLYQNYPNPFNPNTTIKFGIPASAHVTITIYNQLGERVEVLLDKDMEAGVHMISWNARKMASGLYFYEMTTDKFTMVKKLLLMK
jgi:photosystem II stability/assembly factor-like uncharacterized protein